jgi:predicted nucleic acid-binding protein
MADCRIVNASPLITLAKVGQLGLLEEPERELIIPAPVAHEVLRWPAEDPARKALAGGWGGTPVPVEPDADIMEWGLGPGESGVLTLARSMQGVAVIDDGAARAAARALGVRMTGTLGLVLRAARLGRIASAAEVLEQLVDVGLRLNNAVVRDALAQVTGEAWPRR